MLVRYCYPPGYIPLDISRTVRDAGRTVKRHVRADPKSVLFVDIRSVGEAQFAGMPTTADANVPYMLQSEWNEWDEKRHTFKLDVNSALGR